MKLWASSNPLDTDFTAELVDVYPPNADFPAGVHLNVADSIVRARYRNGFGKAELLKPGQPYEFTIEMYPTSLVFKRGHRICFDISSSNFPRFDINPNTGEPPNNNRRLQVAENTIYLDAKHPSAIILPIIAPETTNLSSELKLRKEQRQSSGSDACDSPDQIEVEPSLSQQRQAQPLINNPGDCSRQRQVPEGMDRNRE